jgi:hypothetical protein
MAKFLVTYKVENINYQIVEVDEEDVMVALDNARKRAKALTISSDPENPIKTVWNVVGIKSKE